MSVELKENLAQVVVVIIHLTVIFVFNIKQGNI